MNEPDYYSSNGLSPLKAFEQGLISREEYIGFCKGNVIKYVVRAGKKGDALADIVKAMDYLQYIYKVFDKDSNSEDIIQFTDYNSIPKKELDSIVDEFKSRYDL